MVDDIDNPVVDQEPGWILLIRLLAAFRTLVDEAHALLADRGHPGVRPAQGFALQAVGAGATASQVGERLGVSKQAAAKTLRALELAGYVRRGTDDADARRRTVVPTDRGRDLLAASAAAFDEVVARWREQVPIDDVTRALGALDLPATTRLDLGAWSR